MMEFALFGAGFIGNVHANNIARHPRARLSMVYDVNTEAAQKLADRLGATVADSPDQIWADEAIEAVQIASSTNTHADLMIAAIKANKAVYCEKPVDLDINRVKAVAEQAQQSDVPITIGFSRRFDSNHRAVYEGVRRGDVGQIEMLHLTARDPAPPPISYINVSGGQLRDQTIHFFDLARWICGEDPVEVYTAGACLVDPAIGKAGDIDTSMVTLRMPSGALCHLNSSRRAAYGYDERIEVFGSEGMLESGRKRTGDVSLYRGNQVASSGLHPDWFERLEDSFGIILDTFITAVENGERPSPSLIDGLKAQLIAEAAVESLQTNRPVEIEYWEPGTA